MSSASSSSEKGSKKQCSSLNVELEAARTATDPLVKLAAAARMAINEQNTCATRMAVLQDDMNELGDQVDDLLAGVNTKERSSILLQSFKSEEEARIAAFNLRHPGNAMLAAPKTQPAPWGRTARPLFSRMSSGSSTGSVVEVKMMAQDWDQLELEKQLEERRTSKAWYAGQAARPSRACSSSSTGLDSPAPIGRSAKHGRMHASTAGRKRLGLRGRGISVKSSGRPASSSTASTSSKRGRGNTTCCELCEGPLTAGRCRTYGVRRASLARALSLATWSPSSSLDDLCWLGDAAPTSATQSPNTSPQGKI